MAVVENFDQLEAAESFSLVVAWHRGKTFDGGELRVSNEIGDHLRKACAATIDRLRELDVSPYSADMQLEEEERLEAEDPQMIRDSPLAQLLLGTQRRRLYNARSLPTRSLLLYAISFSMAGEGRLAFVRKTNPRRAVKAGGILGMLGNALTKLDQPVFTLDPYFDLVITERGVVAVNQRVFETLFKESDSVLEAVPAWVQSITDHLPIAGDGAAELAEKCRTDGRLRRRLRSIIERGHLANVTLDEVRAHLQELQLEEGKFIQDDELVFDDADPFTLMALLNEDLFSGGLTGTGFRSERKSTR